MYVIRDARETDVQRIRELIVDAYGNDYAYRQFYDLAVLKKMVFCDDTALFVAEDTNSGNVVGTAAVILDSGSHSDLIGEFGRLVVAPQHRRRGIAKQLLQARSDFAKNRLHVALVEPRLRHTYSQKNAVHGGFAPVGMLPMQLCLQERESVALCAKYFGDALRLRKNNPRIIPEAHALAQLAMQNCGMSCDAIVDERSAPYPFRSTYSCDTMTTSGYLPLLHIERGRVHHREIFGPMKLHHGLFKLRAEKAHYITVKDHDHVVAAAGLVVDLESRSARIFELIAEGDEPIRFLLAQACKYCGTVGATEYLTVDVSAYSPRMQRTLLEIGFLPVAYVPAMVFADVERLDAVRMVKLKATPCFENVDAVPEIVPVFRLVADQFTAHVVAPAIAEAVQHASLFHGLDREQSNCLALGCKIKPFQAGDILYRRGERDQSVYLVLRGKVGITLDESDAYVGYVGRGETLGEMSLLTGTRHFASARAIEPLETAVLPHGTLNDLVRARPDIGVILYHNLALGLGQKLRRADLQAEV